HFALADLKMDRLLDTFDDWASRQAGDAGAGPRERFEPTRAPESSRLELDVTVVDRKGQLRHDGGVVDAPGLYAMGLPVLRRRKSTFIHGAEDDARDVVEHLVGYLAAAGRQGP